MRGMISACPIRLLACRLAASRSPDGVRVSLRPGTREALSSNRPASFANRRGTGRGWRLHGGSGDRASPRGGILSAMPPRDPGCDLVLDLLKDRYGLPVERIPRAPPRPTPDICLPGASGDQFVCEVKTLTAEGRYYRSHEVGIEGLRSAPDRGPERVGKAIQKAYDQLRRSPVPRVLAIVNLDILDVHDLDTAVGGGYVSQQGDRRHLITVAGAERVAKGKVGERFRSIDLYLWIDANLREQREDRPRVHLRAATPAGKDLASNCFNAPRTGWSSIQSSSKVAVCSSKRC